MTRGKTFLKILDPSLSPESHTVFLFLLSKGTEVLHTYLDSDFVVLAHIVECEPAPENNNNSVTAQTSTLNTEIPAA